MREAAKTRHVNGVAAPTTYGSVVGSMATWDAEKIYGCACDGKPYLEGGGDANSTNCAVRDCPRGDDVNTAYGQRDEVQAIWCSATSGTFTLTLRGETTEAIPFDAPNVAQWTELGTATVTQHSASISSTSADFSSLLAAGDVVQLASANGHDVRNYTAASDSSSTVTMTEAIGMASETGTVKVRKIVRSLKSYVEGLASVGTVNVSYSAGNAVCSSGGVYAYVGFLSDFGDLPLMTATNSLAGGSDSVIVMEHAKGTKENAECSLHGECNRETGLCKCFDSWRSSDGTGKAGQRGDCGARDRRASGDFE